MTQTLSTNPKAIPGPGDLPPYPPEDDEQERDKFPDWYRNFVQFRLDPKLSQVASASNWDATYILATSNYEWLNGVIEGILVRGTIPDAVLADLQQHRKRVMAMIVRAAEFEA